MNRSCNILFVIVILLTMQALSLLHLSKYGAEEHEHNGQVCDLYVGVDYNKLLSHGFSELVVPFQLVFKDDLSEDASFLSDIISVFKARAPPLFS